jgi:hypothetical protein
VKESPMLMNLLWLCLALVVFGLLYLLVAAAERW